jgi:hypothetical protein
MNLITDTLLMYWQSGRRTKKTPSGWITGNAPCCQDTRYRGGFIINADDAVSYHCFNCGFKASWQPGRHISKKMKDFMRFMNIGDSDIAKLVFEAFRIEGSELIQMESLIPKFDNRVLPRGAQPITKFLDNVPQPLIPVLEYMESRNLCLDDYPFYWTPKTGFNDRLIMPYYYENRIVGYTARLIKPSSKHPRYLSEQQPDFVFNLDRQKQERAYVIVCEGPLDAISIDGCAILGSEIKDRQNWLIKRLNKEIILVPDRDHEGNKTVEQAIEYGWSVSMPAWPEGVKDVNDAVIKLGRLATLWLIINAKQSYSLKIQLRARQFFKDIK